MSLLGTYSSGSYRGWQSGSQFFNNYQIVFPNTITTGQRVGYRVLVTPSKTILATSDPGGSLKIGYEFWDPSGTYTEASQFSAPDSPSPSGYGSGIAWIAVGDYLNNGTGAIYLPGQKISGPSGSWFGFSVSSTVDNCVLVGAPAAAGGGKAYLYLVSGSSWVLQQTINAPSGAVDFGWSVSLVGELGNLRAVIGAPSTTVSGAASTGTAYIYSGSSSLSLDATVNGFTGAGVDLFGRSVSMSQNGNYVVVGSERRYNGSVRPGGAYVYVRSGSSWSLQQLLLGTSQVDGDLFGCSVSLNDDGNMVAIGSYGYDSGGQTDKGACYVFFRNNTTWTQNNLLVPPNEPAFPPAYFGYSVSMAGDGSRIAIGAPSWDYSSMQGNTGAVFIYY